MSIMTAVMITAVGEYKQYSKTKCITMVIFLFSDKFTKEAGEP